MFNFPSFKHKQRSEHEKTTLECPRVFSTLSQERSRVGEQTLGKAVWCCPLSYKCNPPLRHVCSEKIFWKKWQCFSWLSVSPIISHFPQSYEAASPHTVVSSSFNHCSGPAQVNSWAVTVWLDPCSARVAKPKRTHWGPSTLSLRIKLSFLVQSGTFVRHLSRPSLCHCNPLLGDLPPCLPFPARRLMLCWVRPH